MNIRPAATPLQALYNVFVVPALGASRTHTTRLVGHPRHYQRITPATQNHSLRQFHATPSYLVKSRPPQQRDQLWNKEIPARLVQLVDEETKKLLEPQTRYDVLRTIDEKTHRLVCLSPLPPKDQQEEWIPVCKIVSKEEQYRAEKARKEQAKEKKKGTTIDSVKTLELNWAIDANDLGHRLKRMEEFLGEGRKVEIVLARKKQGRRASVDECEDVLRRIRETVEGVKGAKESKPLEGKIGGVATLSLEGSRQ